jgi:cell division protein FtsI (penicillin-binding protein 3)
VLFTIVVGRLGQLQITGAEALADLGDAQTVRSVALPAARGSVFDRNGQDLALSVARRTVWADPRYVEDAAASAAALGPVLGLDPLELAGDLEADASFIYLARQVDETVAEAVEALALPGVHLLDEPSRFRPAGDLARSILGDVNVDNVGRSGLELQYDDVLTGEPGELVVERDPGGRTIPQGERQLRPAVPGDDLVLTIDRSLQYEAERALADQIVAMDAAGGTLVATDPRTNEILTMASLTVPDDGGDPAPTGANRALVDVFEPGSVNKVITMAAALEEGVLTPTDTLVVPDNLQVADKRFTDSSPHPTMAYTPTDILARSSNVGTIMLGQRVGPDRIDAYLRAFGYGETSGLGFPDESPGLLLDPDDWSGTSIGTIPIGQGVAVNALQMLGAYNVIANDGVLTAPSLVRSRIDGAGVEHPVPASDSRRVVSEETAGAVRDMLVAVVDAGTGREAAIDGYAVAGKTGTARKPQPTGGYERPGGGYDYVSTFAGFVPAQDPQLSVIVVIDEPVTSIYAGDVAAPVFARFARYALGHLAIPPSGTSYEYSVPPPIDFDEPGSDGDAPAPGADGRVRSEAATGDVATDDGATGDAADDEAPDAVDEEAHDHADEESTDGAGADPPDEGGG